MKGLQPCGLQAGYLLPILILEVVQPDELTMATSTDLTLRTFMSIWKRSFHIGHLHVHLAYFDTNNTFLFFLTFVLCFVAFRRLL